VEPGSATLRYATQARSKAGTVKAFLVKVKIAVPRIESSTR
jgi:hypothetical protein